MTGNPQSALAYVHLSLGILMMLLALWIAVIVYTVL